MTKKSETKTPALIAWHVREAKGGKAFWTRSLADDYGLDTAHLEIEAVAPERAPLPITETGYRSHFTTAHTVAAMGGPVALVLTWLNEEAASPAWQREVAATRQLTLF